MSCKRRHVFVFPCGTRAEVAIEGPSALDFSDAIDEMASDFSRGLELDGGEWCPYGFTTRGELKRQVQLLRTAAQNEMLGREAAEAMARKARTLFERMRGALDSGDLEAVADCIRGQTKGGDRGA